MAPMAPIDEKALPLSMLRYLKIFPAHAKNSEIFTAHFQTLKLSLDNSTRISKLSLIHQWIPTVPGLSQVG